MDGEVGVFVVGEVNTEVHFGQVGFSGALGALK